MNDKDVDCYICLDNTQTYIVEKECSCKIYIHKSCYNSWLNYTNKCMICKKNILHNYKSIHQYYWAKNIKLPFVIKYMEFINNIFTKIIDHILKKSNSLIGFILLFLMSILSLVLFFIPMILLIYTKMIFHIITKNREFYNLIDRNYKIYNI